MRCAKTSSGLRSMEELARSPCSGGLLHRACGRRMSENDWHAAGPRLDLGHQLWSAGSLIFCKKCACYGSERTAGLRTACNSTPEKRRNKRTTLDRLMQGLHPVTKAWLGRPTRRERGIVGCGRASGVSAGWMAVHVCFCDVVFAS